MDTCITSREDQFEVGIYLCQDVNEKDGARNRFQPIDKPFLPFGPLSHPERLFRKAFAQASLSDDSFQMVRRLRNRASLWDGFLVDSRWKNIRQIITTNLEALCRKGDKEAVKELAAFNKEIKAAIEERKKAEAASAERIKTAKAEEITWQEKINAEISQRAEAERRCREERRKAEEIRRKEEERKRQEEEDAKRLEQKILKANPDVAAKYDLYMRAIKAQEEAEASLEKTRSQLASDKSMLFIDECQALHDDIPSWESANVYHAENAVVSSEGSVKKSEANVREAVEYTERMRGEYLALKETAIAKMTKQPMMERF